MLRTRGTPLESKKDPRILEPILVDLNQIVKPVMSPRTLDEEGLCTLNVVLIDSRQAQENLVIRVLLSIII